MLVKLQDIKIGNRFRRDLGSIDSLVQSIKTNGLLQPIVLTNENQLICGRRRIEAYKQLGRTEIEAHIFNELDLAHFSLSEAEVDENIVRKAFTIEEISQIDEFYREKEESAARERQKSGRRVGNFPEGRSREKIAKRIGVSDRTLEKIRVIREASLENPTTYGELWGKVGEGKMKIDKGYNYVKKIEKIRAAEKLALNDNSAFANSKFVLKLGPIQEKGSEIADNSIDLIITDPPYNEESIPLYDELAKLAQRVLKPGGSLVSFIGHYALFKIGKLIAENSQLEYHWQLIVKHNGHTAKMWKQRVWPKYKPMLWYYKPNDGENGPTMFSDIEDLIESEPVDKTLHDWQQSTVEVERVIKTLTVENQTVLDPFMGSGTTGIEALELKRKFIGIEIDQLHYSNAARRLTKFQETRGK